MTQLPPELERFAAFMSDNDSPLECVPGKQYRVPCISHKILRRKDRGWGMWVPLIGPVHEDRDVIGFEPWHIHVDSRFLTMPKEMEPSHYGSVLAAVVCLTARFLYPFTDIDELRRDAKLQMRSLVCRRAHAPRFPAAHASWFEELENKHLNCQVVNGRCPHRGIHIQCGHKELNGEGYHCPGHGLRWGADGRLDPQFCSPELYS